MSTTNGTFHSSSTGAAYPDFSAASSAIAASTTTASRTSSKNSNSNNNNPYESFTENKSSHPGAYLTSNEIVHGDPNFYHLKVPPNIAPGTTFEFTISTRGSNSTVRQYSARCPPDCGPGHVLQVAVLPEKKTMYKRLNSARLTVSSLTETKSVGGARPMKPDVRSQNELLLQSLPTTQQTEQEDEDPTEPTSLIVTIPDTVKEGMQFVVATKEQKKFLVECPIGAKPGSKVRVLVPPTIAEEKRDGSNGASHLYTASGSNDPNKPSQSTSTGQKRFKLFDIVVPQGALPNQLLPVNVYGKRVPVRLPANVEEGQTITLKVPLEEVMADLELDYEQIDTSLTGGWNRTIRMEDFKFQWVNSNLKPQLSSNDTVSTRSISTAIMEVQDAIRDIAFVRRLTQLAANDPRMPTALVELVPPSFTVTDSEFRLHPLSKPLVTYATTAQHIQSRSKLDIKQEWLYQQVFEPMKQYANQDGTKVRLQVRRSNLLADSVHCVMALSPREMKKPWQIEFIGEPALDYGGVMRGKNS